MRNELIIIKDIHIIELVIERGVIISTEIEYCIINSGVRKNVKLSDLNQICKEYLCIRRHIDIKQRNMNY